MVVRRVLLTALALGLAVPLFLVLTTDVLQGQNNCGTALISRDPTNLVVGTGDLVEDDFEAQEIRDRCAQSILRQRFFAAMLAAIAAVAAFGAWRSRPAEPRFGGDPIV